MMAFAIVAVVAIGCFVLMDADDSDAETSGSCGENLTWSIDGEGNLTITGTGAMTDYEYWDTRWGGNPVTTVSLPAGLTSIGNSAFYGCTSLASVTIPDSVMTIGSKAFRGCTSLASVTIPDSVMTIGLEAFYRCNSLASVTIPDSVTSIGNFAFYGCSLLASVTIPDSVTSIGNSTFSGCDSLASVTIPDSVTTLEMYAFYGCDSLASVTIPDSVTTIGYAAFAACTSLASVTIPDSVTTIDSDVFGACTSLASVTIPDSVTTIGSAAFAACTSLSSITIPNSVTTIGESAFYGCTSLAEVNVSCTNPLGITKGTEGNGHVAYYATTVNPIIHTYSATYEWADDGSSCTVHIVCANDAAHNHDLDADVSSSVKIAPTCTAMGTHTYSVSGTYDGFAYSDSKDVVDITALTHAYSATYGWADDGSSCTVHIVCANDASHNHDIVAQVASSVKIQPTCTVMGTTTYSVSGTYDGFAYSSSKDVVDIPAQHAYSATYEWAADGSSCTVHIVCANDAAHNHDLDADVSSSVKSAPTCTAMGTHTYSVSGTYDGFAYSDSKDVVDITALTHAYSATYEWAADGSSCTVHIVCANDAAHNHDIVAQVASSVKIQPTATTKGTTEYSVSGTYDGFAYSDTKDVQDIPATGGSDSGNSDSNKKESPITYLAIGIVAVLALAILLIRRR